MHLRLKISVIAFICVKVCIGIAIKKPCNSCVLQIIQMQLIPLSIVLPNVVLFVIYALEFEYHAMKLIKNLSLVIVMCNLFAFLNDGDVGEGGDRIKGAR